MLGRIRPHVRRPSVATIVALIALFVALGGPSYANHVVQRALFANKAKRADNATFARSAKRAGKVDGFNASSTPIPNTLLALGPDGRFPASALPPGTSPGSSSPATRFIYRQGVGASVPDGDLAEAHVGCLEGERMVGGGGGFIRSSDSRLDPRGVLSVNAPAADLAGRVTPDQSERPSLWQVAGQNRTGQFARLVAYAVCSPAP